MNRVGAKQAGFTLLEMIVVLVIIGLLMGLVGPSLFSQADKAKIQTAETQIKMLRGALLTMRLDLGRLPTSDEGLALLRSAPSGERGSKYWQGPYLDEAIPLDPWKNPYVYKKTASVDGQPFSLYSVGADGAPGGEGFDEDIGYLAQ